MPPNNNLRSVLAQYRNYSTRSRCKLSSCRCNNVSKGDSIRDGFMYSIAYGHFAFVGWAMIELQEYRRTMVRDLRELGFDPPSLAHDLRNMFRKW